MMYERKDGGCAARVLAIIYSSEHKHVVLWIEAIWDKRREGNIKECRNLTVVSVPYFVERYGVRFRDIKLDYLRRRAVTTDRQPKEDA